MKRYIQGTSASPRSSDPPLCLCRCTFSSLCSDSFLPLTLSLNYHRFHTTPSHFDSRSFSALFLSLSTLLTDPPPIPPCRIITTSPAGRTSAPCISPTRGADGGATTASSRRRRSSPTGPEPSTSAFTSRTGSPRPPPSGQTAHTPCFWVDPEVQAGGVGMFSSCGRRPAV